MAGSKDMLRWLRAYFNFTLESIQISLLISWFPQWATKIQPWLEQQFPSLWLQVLTLKCRLEL